MRLFDADQSAGLILGQQHRRRDDLVDQLLLLIARQGRDAGEDIGLAHAFQQAADLRLENDDDGQEAPVDEHVRQIGKCLQAEELGDGVNDDDQKNALENLNRPGIVADDLDRII